jgi:hypothetical protein
MGRDSIREVEAVPVLELGVVEEATVLLRGRPPVVVAEEELALLKWLTVTTK